MDRRLLPLAALALAACGGQRAPRAAAPDAGLAAKAPPLPPLVAVEPDAAVDEPPEAPVELLSGAAAEQVIADLEEPPRAPPPGEPGERVIRPTGVGPFELGATRRDALAALGRRARTTRVRTAPGEASVEWADLPGVTGTFLRLRIYGGRVVEIDVLGNDGHTHTDRDVAVGTTFDDAVLAHGDARRSGRGFVLSDLPGVIFIPEDPIELGRPAPSPAARIGSIAVVGTEAD